MVDHECCLCKSHTIKQVDGIVRDMPERRILKCSHCGLVFLDNFDHITNEFYSESRMRKEDQVSNWDWIRYLRETEKDDMRRAEYLINYVLKGFKSILDFGCGAGGFLKKIKLSSSIWFNRHHPVLICAGVEEDTDFVKNIEKNFRIKCYGNINEVKEKYDIITMFHVIEHLKDPIGMLAALSKNFLKDNGQIIIETPNSNDALLSLYESKAFSEFYFIKSHLFLFNKDNLKKTIVQSGLKPVSINQIQRYPLSNTLRWLAKGEPGGHEKWQLFNDERLNIEYSNCLKKIYACDTLFAVTQKE